MLIDKRKFICRLMVVISVTGLFTLSNAVAVPRCGNFEMVDIPNRIYDMAPFSDGTLTAIGFASDGSNNQALLHFDVNSWNEQSLPSEVDGFIFGTGGSTPDGNAWFAGTRTVSVYELDIAFMRTFAGSVDRVEIIRVSQQNNGAPLDFSAISSDNVYAYSSGGDVYHFNGSNWSVIDVPNVLLDQHINPKGIYAVSSNDIWLAGYASVGKGTDKGYVQHWDGSSWEVVPTPYSNEPSTVFFHDIDGTGPNDIWVSGRGVVSGAWENIAMHWDGSSWTKTSGPVSDITNSNVLALEPDNTWILPDRTWTLPKQSDDMHYWDGAAWNSFSNFVFPNTANIVSVRDFKKAGSCDAWVVGDFHDGTAYQPWAARLMPGEVTLPPPPPPSVDTDIYVQNTEVTRIRESRRVYSGLATVTVVDADSIPVSGATVSGGFSGNTSESLVAITRADGTAVFSSGSVYRPDGDWCFTVTNVEAAETVYDKTMNINGSACEAVSDGGSGGKGGKGKK